MLRGRRIDRPGNRDPYAQYHRGRAIRRLSVHHVTARGWPARLRVRRQLQRSHRIRLFGTVRAARQIQYRSCLRSGAPPGRLAGQVPCCGECFLRRPRRCHRYARGDAGGIAGRGAAGSYLQAAARLQYPVQVVQSALEQRMGLGVFIGKDRSCGDAQFQGDALQGRRLHVREPGEKV